MATNRDRRSFSERDDDDSVDDLLIELLPVAVAKLTKLKDISKYLVWKEKKKNLP